MFRLDSLSCYSDRGEWLVCVCPERSDLITYRVIEKEASGFV